jgi:phosphoglycolate phosphatase
MDKRFPEIKLLVYDMDGTLVDAFGDIHEGINKVLAGFGLPPRTYEQVRRGVGEGARNLIKRMIPPDANVDPDALYVAYRTYYAEHPIVRAGLYPAVAETLDALRARGIRQAILTNKPDEVARPICDRLDLTRRMDGIWGEIDGAPCKPDAEAMLEIVRHFNLEPRQCAMVGDGFPDCEVAARPARASSAWPGPAHARGTRRTKSRRDLRALRRVERVGLSGRSGL